jgi:hypothetical protein
MTSTAEGVESGRRLCQKAALFPEAGGIVGPMAGKAAYPSFQEGMISFASRG